MTMNDPPVQASIAPWMAVSDGAKAVEYYGNALGAVERYRLEDGHGRVAVAQLEVGGAVFWVQEDADGSPRPGSACPIRIILSVDDPDALFARAIAAGAARVAPVAEEHGWRSGRVTDPFGHDWEFARPVTA
jgi:PhnB protein